MSTDSMDSGAARELSRRRALTPPPLPAVRRPPRRRRSRSHSVERPGRRRHTDTTDDQDGPAPRLSADRLLGANVLLAPHPRWRTAATAGMDAQLQQLAAPEVARFVPAGRLGPAPTLPSDDPLVLGWLQVQSPPAVPPTGIRQMPFHRNLQHLMRL